MTVLPHPAMNSRSFLLRPFAFTPRVLTAGLLAGFAALGATAQEVTSSDGAVIIQQYSGPPSPPQTSPMERPANLPSLGDQSFWREGTTIMNVRIPRAPGPYFLPPLLPVLGTMPPADPRPLAANYPREFAGEPFFMAYGNLAANNQLSAKRAARINRYRVARLTLLTELREQLSRGRDTSTLAAAQTPRLLELEAEAEQIRHELTRVELFATPADDIGRMAANQGDFNNSPSVFIPATFHLGRRLTTRQDPRFGSALASLRQLLSAAHFQNGFSPDQRRLLEEMALEAQLVIQPEPEVPGPAPIFFWPAGVRILTPAGLPPGAAAGFAEFQRRKAALKDELRAALDRENARLFNIDETEARARLAAAQAPRFAELEALADQLRPALAANLLSARNAGEHRNREPVYATAVLTPGLSPAQRRLLLAAAAEDSLQ